VHKLLETANIKLANMVADVLGISGRAMLDALVAGKTDLERLAKLAKGSLINSSDLFQEFIKRKTETDHRDSGSG